MGLKHWVESDNAADFRHYLLQTLDKKDKRVRVTKLVNTELKQYDNEFNTPGYLNVALCLEVQGKDDQKYGDEPVEPGIPEFFSDLLPLKTLRKLDSIFTKELPLWKGSELVPDVRRLHRVVARIIKDRTKNKG